MIENVHSLFCILPEYIATRPSRLSYNGGQSKMNK